VFPVSVTTNLDLPFARSGSRVARAVKGDEALRREEAAADKARAEAAAHDAEERSHQR